MEHTCLLQVAASSAYRTRRYIDADLEDWRVVSEYAHRFNTHILQKSKIYPDAETDASEKLQGVKVSAPVGCDVLGSSLPQFIAAGDTVLLSVFDPMDVQKFVFDGSEEFMELPQAFFHYAAWSSGGHELVCDIQGAQEEDGSILIIDPCVLRKSPPTVADLIGTVAPMATNLINSAISSAPSDGIAGRFDLLHPKCAQMCKTFDPQRRGGQVRTACGVCIACGV